MNYRLDRNKNPISILGYGCMRFSRNGNSIDVDKAEKEILKAYELGVNYFDTAYVYPGSEVCLGTILARNNLRDKVYIAAKLPQYLIGKASAIDRYFEEELSRLQTDYIDYYLMHMLTDIQGWENLKNLGIEDWIQKKKESGAIRNIGFSFHGTTEMFRRILDDYDWDFCQIQYNYMDEASQAGREGLMAAAEKGIPVIIMEPLRGGKLVHMLPDEAKKLIAADEKHRSPAELGFRWLWNQPEVTCVLSGMNSLAMVEENCRVASEVQIGEFTESDEQLIIRIKNSIRSHMKIGCTECRYCMPCPKGIDIPGTFRCYNEMFVEKKSVGRHEYFQVIGLRKEPAFASQCVGCGKCERHCPQHIPIREELKTADRALLPWYYRIALHVARKYVLAKWSSKKKTS